MTEWAPGLLRLDEHGPVMTGEYQGHEEKSLYVALPEDHQDSTY
jgi:hypothetical protein